MKNPVMYIFVNKGLGMSTGKVAAQVGHAVGRAFRATMDEPDDFVELCRYLDKGETKIVLQVRDTEHLLMAERYLGERGVKTFLVIDEGRTEVPPLSPTAMATQIVDKADENIQFALSGFKTYKDDSFNKVRDDLNGFMIAVRAVVPKRYWKRIVEESRL